MKHIFNFAIIVFLLLSVCCNDKQSSRKSADNSEQQTARNNKQYSADFEEAQVQLLAGASLFGALESEYWMNWEALFFGRLPAADIKAGEEAMRQGEGGTLSSELQQAIAFAHAENCHRTVGKFLDKIKNPPMAYAQAYAKLIEAYGAYERLYDIVTRPRGSKQAYREASEEEKRNFQSLYAQVNALAPKLTSSVNETVRKESPSIVEETDRKLKESRHREAEARAQSEAASEKLKVLGLRDPAVAARNEAEQKRIEEIMPS